MRVFYFIPPTDRTGDSEDLVCLPRPVDVQGLSVLEFARRQWSLTIEKPKQGTSAFQLLVYGGRSLLTYRSRNHVDNPGSAEKHLVGTVLTVLPIAVRDTEDQPRRRREGPKISRAHVAVICSRAAGLCESRHATRRSDRRSRGRCGG